MTLKWREKAASKAVFLWCFVALSSLLTGCGSSSGVLRPMVPSAPQYKHNLVVTGDAAAPFVQALGATGLRDSVTITNVPEVGGLQLQLNLSTQEQRRAAGNTPALAGRLTQQQVTPVHTLRYTLSGADGRMVSGGEVVRQGQTVQLFLPRLDNTPIAATPADINGLIEQAATALVPVIQAQPWRARVLGEAGPSHVVIAAGRPSGLNYGDMLQTETQPVATLQVVTLENTPEGQARATLRLITGVLPAAGRALVPAR